MPVLHGAEPVERADSPGAGPEQGRRAGHEGVLAQRPPSKKEPVTLCGIVECDETDHVAGHKGQLEKATKAGRPQHRRRLKGARGRGTKATENPPIFGLVQCSGEAVIHRLDNVRQETIKPLILHTVTVGRTTDK